MTPQQQYLNISRRALDVEDYIDILRRHTSWVLGPLFAGLVISCVVAFFLPNTYISSAVLRITPPQISEILVPSTVSQQMNDRVAQMQAEILSRTSLSELIQRPTLNLYPRERANSPLEDVIEQMRTKDVHIYVQNLAGANGHAATAFSISFQYPDAAKAQAVVQALITRFTEAAVNVQGTQGKATSDFFKDEITQARADLTRLDNELTAFRTQNAGHLPEDLQYNVQNLNVVHGQLGAVEEAITRIGEEKLNIETNLQTLKAHRDELQQLETTTIQQAPSPQNDRLQQLKNDVINMESQLASLLLVYQETYPTVRQYRSQIELKKKERDRLQAEADGEAARPKAAAKTIVNASIKDRLIETQGQIDSLMVTLQNKENERIRRMKQIDDLNNQVKMYMAAIASSPPNQQKYAALVREYSMTEQHYQDLQRRETAATTFDNVGKRKAGENLEVLDNASLPLTPSAPNRWLICAIGTGIGLMAGVFLTGVKEVKDTSLKNLKDVRAYTQLPILSSIPLLENDLLVRRKRRLAYVGWSAAVILGIIAMSGSMYYHYFMTS
jgi:succinoglycan biosynthesis transport protein ExoP